jgi:hypothetical protein
MGTMATRRVEIVAQDPSVKENGKIVTAMVSIPYEDLLPGPMGYAVHVVDYDASSQTVYKPTILPTGDITAPDDIVGDPGYHAANAYAIVMRTLQRFEFALGRRIAWGTGGPQLKVVPHAFEQANAFYSEDAEALVFGYVRSSGAPTFFGLSHDIIVHETTHALLDGLRDGFTEPSSPDQAALHEGLADIVALLSVFSLPEILVPFIDRVGTRARSEGEPRPPRGMLFRESVTRSRLEDTVLLGLADEIRGDAPEARVNALRRSVKIKPRPNLLDEWEFEEPHRRGEVLVAAVMSAFLEAWVDRITDTSVSDSGLVNRAWVAEEGATIADILLTMAIRAIDYTPPIHIEFGDYLSAIITADLEVRPDDSRYGLRLRLREAFKRFGIAPAGDPETGGWRPPRRGLSRSGAHYASLQADRTEVFRVVWANREALRLDPDAFTRVTSVRPAFRVSPEDGFHIRETVVECTQYLKVPASRLADYGLAPPEGMPLETEVVLRGGSTLIFDEYGELKYNVHNLIPGLGQSPKRQRRAQRRLDYLWENGFLDEGASLTKGLAVMHRARLLGTHSIGRRRGTTIPTDREETWV